MDGYNDSIFTKIMLKMLMIKEKSMILYAIALLVGFLTFKLYAWKTLISKPSRENVVNQVASNDYINSRLIPQMDWFDKQSNSCKKKYQAIKLIQTILFASLPFLAGLVDKWGLLIYVIGLIGVILSILEGVLSFKNYHENWLNYRTKCEILKKHYNLYQNNVTPYNDNESLGKLIHLTEDYLGTEVNDWYFRNGKN